MDWEVLERLAAAGAVAGATSAGAIGGAEVAVVLPGLGKVIPGGAVGGYGHSMTGSVMDSLARREGPAAAGSSVLLALDAKLPLGAFLLPELLITGNGTRFVGLSGA